jgi:bifunctional non-homologous end joining protein LigD
MPDHLKKYRSMRDFGATPEPSGARGRKKGGPIFVIQKHQASHLHYDFRLEMEGVLKSWAVPKGPSYDPGVKRLAMMTEDHPYDYAGFEGVIPEGNYGAGNVIVWDTGTWTFIEPGDDPVKALKEGKLAFRLEGKKMFGEWALVRIHGRSPKGNEWLLLKHRDAFANETIDVTELAPQSVVSGKTVEEVNPANVWKSNRAAKVRKVPTLAESIAKKKPAKKLAKPKARTTAKKAAAPSKKKSASATPRRRAAAAPTRAASAPTRSSRSRSPRAARSTSRRPPR